VNKINFGGLIMQITVNLTPLIGTIVGFGIAFMAIGVSILIITSYINENLIIIRNVLQVKEGVNHDEKSNRNVQEDISRTSN